MVVYVEYVIFDNFLLDAFIGLLVCNLLRIKKYRAIFCAIIGSGLALIYPTVENRLVFLYKILTLFCTCIPLCKKTLFDYLKSAFCFACFSFFYSGGISLILGVRNDVIPLSDGMKVGIISAVCIVGYFIIVKLINALSRKKDNGKYCNCVLYSNNKKLKTIGFFDNGNMAVASDGYGIIFLDKKLSNNIDAPACDYVSVDTVNGQSVFTVLKIEKIEIYFEGKKHIYKNVNAVKTARTYDGFQTLLSNKLKEM